MTYTEYNKACARIENELIELDPEKDYLKMLILADQLKTLDNLYKKEREQ